MYSQLNLYSESGVVTGLMTARAVADLLGVTPATVLRWTRAGELPAVRLPSGQVRYRADDLEEWLTARATSRSPDIAAFQGQNTASQSGKGVTLGTSATDMTWTEKV